MDSLNYNSNLSVWGARLVLFLLFATFIYKFIIKKRDKNIIYNVNSKNLKNDAIINKTVKHAQSFFDNFFGGISKTKFKKPKINKTENKCRNIIENIYKASFPSVRPDFLQSPKTGRNLELDCYNEQLGIALEYNGIQHYKYSPHFHKCKKDFYSQVHRDDWKRQKCRERGITLIEIPYWITPDNLETFIVKELRKYGKL